MSADLNLVLLIGRVGKDPEYGMVGERRYAKFSLATSRYWMDKPSGKWNSKTQWHSISVWGYVVDALERLGIKKGDLVHVSGSIEYSKYKRDDGNIVNLTTINCNEVKLLRRQEEGMGNVSGDKLDSVDDVVFDENEEDPF